MRKKWIIAAFILAPICLAGAVSFILQSQGSISTFDFLHDAKVLELERVRELPSKAVMRYEVYNVNRPFKLVAGEIESEVKPLGYTDISWFRNARRAWVKTTAPGGVPTGIVGTELISIADGMSKIVPVSNPNEWDHIHTVEGWTTIVLAEEYKPSRYEQVLDLFRGPVLKDVKHMDVQLVPSKGAVEFLKREGR